MESNRTAVEYLIEELSNYDSKMIELFNKEIKQAKEMEKQQIIDAWVNGGYNWDNTDYDAKYYYEKTFNK
jgi:hypothetical protein